MTRYAMYRNGPITTMPIKKLPMAFHSEELLQRSHMACILHERVNLVIGSLLLCCSPSAVGRLVVPVIINTIYGRALRPRSHVGKEVLERATLDRVPSVTHRNSPSAISRPTIMRRVMAALQHASPRAIDGGPRKPMFYGRSRVSDCELSSFPAAATRPRGAVLETLGQHRSFIATVTETEPCKAFTDRWEYSVRRLRKYDKLTEALSGQLFMPRFQCNGRAGAPKGVVVLATKAANFGFLWTVINRASDSLSLHLGIILSGVMGRAVPAAAPLNYTLPGYGATI